MKCPICKNNLIVGEHRRYQSSCEHVFDPNYVPAARPTYECTCENSSRYFWNDDGELYVKKGMYDYNITKQHEKEYSSLTALDSIEREIEDETISRKKVAQIK